MDLKSYTELDVWKEARKLVTNIYIITRDLPKEELFGLTNQMRRCAVSVPSNIAEGCGRNHPKDSIQFFFIARGSLYELETQLFLCFDLNYITQDELEIQIIQIETSRKLLNGFIRYYKELKEKSAPRNS